MPEVLAIDPGNEQSAYALIDATTFRPLAIGKVPNAEMRDLLASPELGRADVIAVEMVASYGMPVGREVFDTCVWIGRFVEITDGRADQVFRSVVKLHLCHTSKAKDSNISQALVDRFASGKPNRGKGTKAEPGWFHGFHDDIWQAYALAVTVADREQGAPF